MYIWAKYGVALTLRVPVIKAGSQDFAVGANWTPAAGDVKVVKNGSSANIGTLPSATAHGNSALWTITLTATEMQAAEVLVLIADAATKAVEDQLLAIHTYGHASAFCTGDLTNLDVAVSSRSTVTEGQVNAQCDTALADIRLDELLQVVASPADPTIGSFIDRVMDKDGAQTFDPATDSLEALADGGGVGLTAAAAADAVWDELFGDHQLAGSFGKMLDSPISSLPGTDEQ